MSDLTTIVQGVVSGLLAGGATALTTIGATFRDLKKRIAVLEEKVGNPDPRTGVYLVIGSAVDDLRKLKREIESWPDSPPDWMLRLIRSRANSSSMNLEIFQELEGRVEARFKGLTDRIRSLEEQLEEHTKRTKNVGISRSEYDEDSKHRAEEIAKVRENLSVTNGFLRGVMATLGYLDDEPPTSPGMRRR